MFCNYCGTPNPDISSFCSKCGKAVERPPAAAPAQAKPIDHIVATPSAPTPGPSAAAARVSPARQETPGKLAPAARTEFTDGLIADVRRQIDDKCYFGSIAAGIITLIAVARFSIPEFGQTSGVVSAFVAALVLASIVFRIQKSILEDKYLRPIANISDEMLVARYNEAKADRRAARTRTAIGWGVIVIIAVAFLLAWLAARR
ncbi:MAG TPA: zinc ribbon domain-containing protein [Candidatus Koribacter sp.]|jgi:hypothetical protein